MAELGANLGPQTSVGTPSGDLGAVNDGNDETCAGICCEKTKFLCVMLLIKA